jgi:hypothetical protein
MRYSLRPSFPLFVARRTSIHQPGGQPDQSRYDDHPENGTDNQWHDSSDLKAGKTKYIAFGA